MKKITAYCKVECSMMLFYNQLRSQKGTNLGTVALSWLQGDSYFGNYVILVADADDIWMPLHQSPFLWF